MMDILDPKLKSQNRNNFPLIMGIINTTDDSFSDGGDFNTLEKSYNQAIKLINDGADILDIGGESTRPGAIDIHEEIELKRTIPLIEKIRKENDKIKISIDTTKYKVALEAINAGADIINDISGLNFEPRLLDLAIKFNKDLVIMHMQGTPRTMQNNPSYNDVVKDIYYFFEKKIDFIHSQGFNNIIIDVGIGFGKNLEHNLELLKNLEVFNNLNAKQLLGISRKSFIGKLFNIPTPKDRDLLTLIFHSLLLNKNINIIRVHNVAQIYQLKTVYNILNNEY